MHALGGKFDVAEADAEASGCAEHSDPECLCDVKLPEGHVPAYVADYVIAEDGDFHAWAAKTVGDYDACRGFLAPGTRIEDLEQARLDYLDLLGSAPAEGAGPWRNAVRRPLDVLVRAGLSYKQIARYVQRPTREVIGYHRSGGDTEAIATAEELLRQGDMTHGAVAEVTGLGIHQVSHMAARLGIKNKVAARMAAGGGVKNSAATVALVRELHAQRWGTSISIRDEVHRRLPESRETLTAAGVVGLTRKRAK